MKHPSPTLEGFQSVFRLPALGLAEIAWRWSFGLAVTVLLVFSFREYMSTLPVTAEEMFLLQTRQPALILKAIAHILQGSAPRVVSVVIILLLALTFAWIALASLGRAATLKTLFEREGDKATPRTGRLTSLMVLNCLRAAAIFAAMVGSIGATLLAGAASSKTNPAPGTSLLIFWMLTLLIALAWWMLNWFLSQAAIFVVGHEKTASEAVEAVADLCRSHPGPVIAATTWFGIAHAASFVIATSVAAFPLGLAEVLPAGMVLGGIILVALLYFAVADFLYVGRLAAYVFLTEFPQSFSTLSPRPLSDDDILSDIPGLAPPPQPATG